jgi:hypothetical protein
MKTREELMNEKMAKWNQQASEAMEDKLYQLQTLIDELQAEHDKMAEAINFPTVDTININWSHVGTISHKVQVLDELVNPENH